MKAVRKLRERGPEMGPEEIYDCVLAITGDEKLARSERSRREHALKLMRLGLT